MSVFYAYLNNLLDDNTWRAVIIFATRTVADEWWRAISTSKNTTLRNSVQRISPQFYTHMPPSPVDLLHFFANDITADIAKAFKGRMFITADNDRGGRGITVIPPQEITDHISGNWFNIRCRTNHDMFWYVSEGRIRTSKNKRVRTSFRVTTRDVDLLGNVMIGEDQITLHIMPSGTSSVQTHVEIDDLGALIPSGRGSYFRFSDFELGYFTSNEAGELIYDSDGRGIERWELA